MVCFSKLAFQENICDFEPHYDTKCKYLGLCKISRQHDTGISLGNKDIICNIQGAFGHNKGKLLKSFAQLAYQLY